VPDRRVGGHHVLELPPEQAAVERGSGLGIGMGRVDPARDAGDVAVLLAHARAPSGEWSGNGVKLRPIQVRTCPRRRAPDRVSPAAPSGTICRTMTRPFTLGSGGARGAVGVLVSPTADCSAQLLAVAAWADQHRVEI